MRHLPGKKKSRQKKHLPVTCSGFFFGLLWVAMTVGIPGGSIAGGPVPGREALSPEGAMHIGAEDRCPVCAMLPLRYPRFAAAIELQDARTYYFCSPGCMLNAWQHPDIFLGVATAQLKRPIVSGIPERAAPGCPSCLLGIRVGCRRTDGPRVSSPEGYDAPGSLSPAPRGQTRFSSG